MKFNFKICSKGIWVKPIACYTCKQISHAKCINGLSPELYNKYKVNMGTIPHICKFCDNSNVCINVNVPVDEGILEPTTLDSSLIPLTQAPSHTPSLKSCNRHGGEGGGGGGKGGAQWGSSMGHYDILQKIDIFFIYKPILINECTKCLWNWTLEGLLKIGLN